MRLKKLLFFLFIFIFIVTMQNIYCKNKETFKIALTGKYPPFSFYSEEGNLVGFDVDVAKRIAKILDKDLKIITTEWDGIVAGLLSGKYDAIIGSMAITEERAKKVNFSIPYYTSGAQLFIHKNDKDELKNISDLKGKTVGVGLGETYEHYLRNNYSDINILTYKSTVDIFQDMLNNRLEGFVTDKYVGLYQIDKGNMPFIKTGELLYKEKMAIPVKKEDKKLLKNINNCLEQIKNNGYLEKLFDKWFREKEAKKQISNAMKTNTITKKMLKGFSITLYVAFLSILIGFALSIPSGIILNTRKGVLYMLIRSFNDFIRGTPLLIQLFFVYFGAPQINLILSPVQAAILTLSINCSAYMAEVVKSGLMSVDYGQKLAGRALGLSKFQVFRHIVWPQAFRIALPPLMNSVVALMKDTALIAMISVGEVIREAQSIISVTYNPIKYYFIAALLFFIFTFPLMKLTGKLEKKIKQKGFTNA